MRKLLWLLLAALAVYSGYWLIGARASERGLAAWMQMRAQEGWHVAYEDLQTSGYPLAFHSEFTGLDLADPTTGTAYQTPSFRLETKSYAPTEVTARFAPDALISTPYQRIEAQNAQMFGRLNVGVGTSLPLDTAAFELGGFQAQSTLGWGFTLAQAQLNTARHEADALTHDITFTGLGLTPSASMMGTIDSGDLLADSFERFDIDATVSFDKPWDISALEGPRPQPTLVDLHNITATWGSLDLRLAGKFTVDARGVPNGTVEIKAQNWRDMIALGIAAGAIPRDLERLLLRGGELIAGLKGNKDTIDAELKLTNGQIVLGIFTLGPAPRFQIR